MKGRNMKKAMAVLMFVAMTSAAYAEENYLKSEADRSGVTGTFNMIGNSISGFFSNLGGGIHRAVSKSES